MLLPNVSSVQTAVVPCSGNAGGGGAGWSPVSAPGPEESRSLDHGSTSTPPAQQAGLVSPPPPCHHMQCCASVP